MSDLRRAAEDLMPILDRWKMTYPPCSGADWDKVEALRTALAQEDKECVAIVNEGMGGIEWLDTPLPDDTPLYTAPPKREWVGLTDGERKDIELGIEVFDMSVEDILKEAEAKLKEKNT